MKFDIKRLYKSTIKTLEKHQMEVTIAIAALSIIAFVPESMEEEQAHAEIKALYIAQLAMVEGQIAMLQDLIVKSIVSDG